MKNKHYFPQVSLLICILCCFPHLIHAYSLRQFSNKNGLSNSAILSLYQDHQGVIWIGSCDGLNIFDGTNIHVYNPVNLTKAPLSGNLINDIMETEKDVLWIQTNYGLDRLDTKLQISKSFTEFKDKNYMAKSRDNDLFIVKDDGYIYYYQSEKQLFQKLEVPQIAFGHVLSTIIDKNNILWVFTSNNDTRSYQIIKNKEEIALTPNNLFKHSEQLLWAFAEEDLVYFIDKTYSLYEYDFGNQQQYFIADLKAEVETRGEVSSIIKQQNDYYIGFKSSGLIVLKYMSNQKIKYQMQDTEIHSGIFCLMKDKYQDIVWIGTDGQGVYMYFNDTFSITNTLLDTPVYQINNPVRTVYYDEEQTLWIGTKGGGILRIRNYSPETNAAVSFDRISISNSTLTDNTVYCFAPGSANRLWIGTENGLNYYSYQNKQLKAFTVIADGKKVKYVHSINELNDTTLWVSTVGEGIVKVILDKAGSSPSVKSATRIVLDDGRMASNYFFTSFQENDSILWFGNRGYGAYRLNVETEQLTPYRFDNVVNSQTANDIFAIYKNEKGYWLGTSSGLLHFNEDYSHYHDRADLFSNNTVHGILEDQQNNLWISTNQGLVRFNPKTNTGQTYDRENGLEVTEFSDGAFYKDSRTETLFFGGTNGFVTVKPNAYIMADYMPQINLKGLSIFGKEYNIHDFLHDKKGKKILQLDYSRNFFCIDFMAIDYINGNNYSYSYKLDEVSSQWIESGTSASAIFSNLAPGQYTLLVKYKNNMNGKECEPQKLLIQITPPWYLSNWAYILYFILIALFCILAVYRIVHQYRRKQHRMIEKLNREKKEEVYESKLRFFTNITHEFCTPLTLIYGPCERILQHENSDVFIKKYAQIIKSNTERLNSLIQEVIDFRRMETGNQICHIQELNISKLAKDIIDSFGELAEQNQIHLETNISPDIIWKSDYSGFTKILNNLISNAFKYSPENGTIRISIKIEVDKLNIQVYNTGKGICKENIPLIFNRYSVLDNIQENSIKGLSSRNGLGLAICQSMVELLQGTIEVKSEIDQYAQFIVNLPQLEVTEEAEHVLNETPKSEPLSNNTNIETAERGDYEKEFNQPETTILMIDDNKELLWMLKDILSDEYSILTAENGEEGLVLLKQKTPDLIITDIMMPKIDGITLIKQLKSNKHTMHIPLIILSAKNTTDEKIEGIESGADAYIPKPFNTQYLRSIIKQLLKKQEELKQYYNSSASAFEFSGGQLLQQEDKKFMETAVELINENMDNTEFGPEELAEAMQTSSRNLYRKFKNLDQLPPKDFIKEQRINYAAKLLLTTTLTIQEIMYRTAFTNRSHFYKEFGKRYNQTPKEYRESNKYKDDSLN